MVKLSRRLQAILSELEGETCADIGCDHGKLIVSALLNNKVKFGYAVDISKKSLEKAEALSREEKVDSRMTLLYSDGATDLPEKVSIAVIAGMGAAETVHILSQRDFADKYVLSPHQDPQILRQFLKNNGFFIIKDYIIFDKKYYPIIVASKGATNYSDEEMFFGKNQPETNDFFSYVSLRKKQLDKLNNLIQDKINPKTKAEKEEADRWYNKKSLK